MMTVYSSDTWVSYLVSPSASNYILLSPCQTVFLSPTLFVCIKLQISLFFSPLFHSLPWPNFFPQLAVMCPIPFLTLDECTFLTYCPRHCIWLPPFLFLALPLFVYACLFLLSASFSLCLFLLLSVFICLSGQLGFPKGCTLTSGEMELVCTCGDDGTLQSG